MAKNKFGKFLAFTTTVAAVGTTCYIFRDKIKESTLYQKAINALAALLNTEEDFAEEEDSFEITTDPADFNAVHDALEAENIPMASAEVTMIPQTYVTLTDENDIRQLQRTLDLLDEDDDVQSVYHNYEEA